MQSRHSLVWALAVGLLIIGGSAFAIRRMRSPLHVAKAPAGGGASVSTHASSNAAAPPVRGPDEDPSKSDEIVIDPSLFEDGGLGVAFRFTGVVHDATSLTELRESLTSRGKVGLSTIGAALDAAQFGATASSHDVAAAFHLMRELAGLQMYEGQFDDAVKTLESALALGKRAGLPERDQLDITAVLGIVALRQGEVSNCIACLGPSSCILPIAPEAVHKQQAGSRRAMELFTSYLEARPGELRVRWLLNLAAMTLGEYPDKVPARFRVPLDRLASKLDVGKFENVASAAGLTSRGPNLAGGSIFDDFDGDGRPDLFVTSLDADRGASLFINLGDGTFEDRSQSSGLDQQVYALNAARADFDNDGDLDVLLLRGGWESPMRLSLLKNNGAGGFEDVTVAAGMAEPISTESAAWGDFDNDGLVDLFVCGEYLSPAGGPTASTPDPRNRCRLYKNRGDGTFVDVAEKVGIVNDECAKGSAWGDYDGDGRLDLFVSNMTGPCRLFHNDADGTFRDVAAALKVTGAERSFACWFWDFDNDGRLDLFVNDYSVSLAEWVAHTAGIRADRPGRPRLYRNLGPEGFEDITQAVGLDRPMAPMGCNFGDFDNDGYLDIYLGTGGMSYEYLVPNLLFKNVVGKRFEDVTLSSGTGHLQKGHGISFADFDGDGDLDLFAEAGGAVPGDNAYNLLFKNPGHGRHWLKVKLVGTETNRAALGARIRVTLKSTDGATRSIFRTVGNNSSFGGNSLVESFGLGDSDQIEAIEVSWPVTQRSQVFRSIAADTCIEITEGDDTPKTLALAEKPTKRP